MIDSLSSELMAHLWQSTLVIGVVWLMTLALRGNRARVRYWLWKAASVKFLIPFSWLVSLGAQFEWRSAPAIAQPAATFAMEEILAPPFVTASMSAPMSDPTAMWPWALAAVWVVGFAVVLFWWSRQWGPVRTALRQARPVALGSAYDTAGLIVMSSPSTLEPGVVGIWRPILLLPDGLVDRLTAAQLGALIAHERCHVRCHDNLAAAVHMLVEAIFWFHPLVWWIERRMIGERERACDEAVLGAGNDPDEYVAGILTVCRFTLRVPLACVAGVSGAELRTRIESIVRMELGKRMTFTRRVAVALVAAVLPGVPLVAGLVSTPVVTAAQGPKSPVVSEGAAARQTNAGQTASTLRFEVASIKRNNGDAQKAFVLQGYRPGGSFGGLNVTLGSVIRLAYGLQDFQMAGAPKWVDTDRFDVEARGPQGATQSEVPRRLQSLLAERFALKAHMETRDHPIYALVLARADRSLGPRLRRSQFDAKQIQEQDARMLRESPATFTPLECGLTAGRRLGSCGSTMASLATRFPMYVGRIAVDQTGLTGLYQYDLHFGDRPIPGTGPGGGFPFPVSSQAGDPDAPSLFTALEEQLGLKLVPQTGRIEVLVIDHVEPPKPN
jgi:bla regulator protein blaR1